jgi:transposase-like protein
MEAEVRTESPRRFGIAVKRLILQEHLHQGTSLALLARRFGVHPVTLYAWKRNLMMEDQGRKEKADFAELWSELERTRQENRQLKKAVAELAVDKSILQDAVELLKKKKLLPQKSGLRKKSS